jgi:hypothetical protein
MAASRYDSETTKPRGRDERVGPQTRSVTEECLYSAYRRRDIDKPPTHNYELRAALGPPDDDAFCDTARSDQFDLCDHARP